MDFADGSWHIGPLVSSDTIEVAMVYPKTTRRSRPGTIMISCTGNVAYAVTGLSAPLMDMSRIAEESTAVEQ